MGDERKRVVKDEPVYRQLLRLKTICPVIFHTLIILFSLNLVVGGVVPLFMPEQLYLYFYLSKEGRVSTERFRNGEDSFLVYDEISGWRNRPNVKYDKWVVDKWGARTTHPVGTVSSKKRYVMFLGNSLMNGGTRVSNNETISAYIEDASTESINFATMLYSLDQVYLDYHRHLGKYEATVVVVGLPSKPTGGLLNQYIPFRVKVESKIPFFKPRFEMRSSQLSMIPVPELSSYGGLFDSPEVLRKLKRTDLYYTEFSRYKWFSMMPVSHAVYDVYRKITDLVGLIEGDDEAIPLLKNLMNQMVLESRRRHATIIFVTLPDMKTVAPNLWQRYLPDHYGKITKDLRGEGYLLLDVRPILRESGLPVEALFDADGTHYTSAGNRIIAEALKDAIERLG